MPTFIQTFMRLLIVCLFIYSWTFPGNSSFLSERSSSFKTGTRGDFSEKQGKLGFNLWLLLSGYMVTWIGRPSQGGFSIGWIAGSMAELEGYILYWQLCIGSKNHSNNENNFHPHLIHILLHWAGWKTSNTSVAHWETKMAMMIIIIIIFIIIIIIIIPVVF